MRPAKVKKPIKTRKTTLNMRIDPELIVRLKALAAKNRRTMTGELEVAIDRHLAAA